jgi:hypothetical protein
VAGATVVVTNTATNVQHTTQTDTAGQYQVAALFPGTYSVRVTAAGFESALRGGILITVQARPAVDFSLKMGQTTQTVEVNAASPVLQTETADVGGVYQNEAVVDLPLNGRRYSDLALLESGITKDNMVGNPAVDLFSSNGNWDTQNYFSLDGTDNNSGSENLEENSAEVVMPPPDAIQEFKIQTRTYSAEFGAAAGAVVNVSLKSGTNSWHGDLWEFVRNNKMDANTYFNNADGVPNPHYSQNQFGGTIGGPIVKNHTFFFGDAQDYTSRLGVTSLSTVPTPLMMTGNFTELPFALTPSGVAGQGGCVTGNIVSSSCFDKVAMNFLALWPSPNLPVPSGTPGSFNQGIPNYEYVYSQPIDTHTWDVRIDHTINEKNRMFGRFSSLNTNMTWNGDPMPWTSNPLVGDGDQAYHSLTSEHSLALAWDATISPTMLNELRAGYSRDNNHNLDPGLTYDGKSLAPEYGLTGVPDGPYAAGIPTIGAQGLNAGGFPGPYGGIGDGQYHPQFQIAQVWQLADNLSWLKGSHALKFGYEYRKTSLNFLDVRAIQPQIAFDGIYTGQGEFGVPDWELGDVDTMYFTTALVAHNYMYGNSFYAQDTWRMRPHLTVNYGLRYELFSPVLNHQNQMSDFSPANGGGLISVAPNASGWYQRSLLHPNYHNLAPRIGFSYQPFKRVVLRGGYGVFFQHNERIGSESILAQNPPYLSNLNLSQTLGSTTPVMFMDTGVPPLPPGNEVPLPTLQLRAQDPNERTTYVEQTSFGPEIELSPNTALDITYVGNFAFKLNRLRNLNQGIVTSVVGGVPNVYFQWPNLNTATQHAFLEYATNDGNANYHGLLVSIRRHYGNGLGYGISYTYSHSISNNEDNLTANYSEQVPQNAYNYSPERSNGPIDMRHRFTAYSNYQLPVGKGHALLNNGGVASHILGDWQLNGIVTWQTGVPYETVTIDESGTGYGHNDARPNCIGDPHAGTNSNPRIGPLLNFNAFSLPDPGTFGDCAPRNFFAPRFADVDLSLFKEIPFKESRRLEFRLETFNTLNHASFAAPNFFWAPGLQGSFGYVTSALPFTNPRQIQLALKLYF